MTDEPMQQEPEDVEDDDEDTPLSSILYGIGAVLGGAAMLWHEYSDPSDEWTVNGIPMVWVAYLSMVVGLFLAGTGIFKAMKS